MPTQNNKLIVFATNGRASLVTMNFDRFSRMAHLGYIEYALDEADEYDQKPFRGPNEQRNIF